MLKIHEIKSVIPFHTNIKTFEKFSSLLKEKVLPDCFKKHSQGSTNSKGKRGQNNILWFELSNKLISIYSPPLELEDIENKIIENKVGKYLKRFVQLSWKTEETIRKLIEIYLFLNKKEINRIYERNYFKLSKEEISNFHSFIKDEKPKVSKLPLRRLSGFDDGKLSEKRVKDNKSKISLKKKLILPELKKNKSKRFNSTMTIKNPNFKSNFHEMNSSYKKFTGNSSYFQPSTKETERNLTLKKVFSRKESSNSSFQRGK